MLSGDEVSLVFAHLRTALGVDVECQGALLGGRSGAALYAAIAADEEQLVIRVTTKKRAERELHALRMLPSARPLWPTMGPQLIHLLPIARGFPVAATVTRHLSGAMPQYSTDLCTGFSELFEGDRVRQAGFCPASVVKPHLWLLDLLPEYAAGIRRSLTLALHQDWEIGFGHGDPSLGNLIATSSGRILPIDFASGGTVVQRLHRARWAHAVHGPVAGDDMDCGACPTADPIAFIADAARRLRSDAADPVRSFRWRARVVRLFETVL